MYLYNGIPSVSAAALATASDRPTARFPPILSKFPVPSRSPRSRSRSSWSNRLIPTTCGMISDSNSSIALSIPPLGIACASYIPVLAPDGDANLPNPSSPYTSISTVGFPRLSSIFLMNISSISDISTTYMSYGGLDKKAFARGLSGIT